MKESFLALVKEVKDTGIANVLCNTTNAEQLKAAWQKFETENPELFQKVEDWASKYDGSTLFADGEDFQDPIEITVVIHIIDNGDISECEIFESYEDLTCAVKDIPGEFAAQLAEVIDVDMICDIEAEDIFDENEEDDN